MTRYFFVVLVMGLIGVAIIVKGTVIMFAERQYWQDVADRFVKDPREVVKVGDIVKVRVLDVDVARKRISLSMKSKSAGDRAKVSHGSHSAGSMKPAAKRPERPAAGAMAAAFAGLKLRR